MNTSFDSSFSDLKLPLYGVRLPEFQIENAQKFKYGLTENASNYDFLIQVCRANFKKLNIPKEDYPKYSERIKYELETIKELGFLDYILLVWNVINYCNENSIPVGLGRGSAAGSLVLYLLKVTKVDPIKYELFFERFISKIRAKKQVVDGITYLDGSLMCDVDIDICYYNRPKVIKYLEQLFSGRTSKILTLTTLSGKLLIKECGKIIDEKSETEMNEVSSLIPKTFGQVMDLKEAYEQVPELKKWCDENSRSYKAALKIRNLIKNKSVHASGMMLSYFPIEVSCPTELTTDKEQVSSYDMNWASISNVKLDLLGLRSVSIVDRVCKLVNISVSDIDFNDPIIYQNLQDLKTPHGCFQIEAETNFKVCRKVKPKNLEELSGVLALARPGALEFVDQYANFTNNNVYEPIHPFFDSVLNSSGGVALYQEQLMKMSHKIGFTLDEAEVLRRIVGKKKVEEVKKWKEKISDKIKENNLAPEIGDILWRILENSANYSFNKSHSVSYAALAACTVYLKFKYPKEFFLALLEMTKHEPAPLEEISKIQKELRHFGIKLLGPHILKSETDFSIEDNNIRFGLSSIKGISEKTMEKLKNFKSNQSNKFEVFQAAKEAGISIGVVSALIQAGALDGFSASRSRVVLEAQLWNLLTEKEKILSMQYGPEEGYDLLKTIKKLSQTKNENGKLLIKETRLATIKNKYDSYLKIYQQNNKSESFANWFYENKLLGYSYDNTLINIFKPKLPSLVSSAEINQIENNSIIFMVGKVEEVSQWVSKNEKKTRVFKMTLSDEYGTLSVLMFNDKIDYNKSANNDKLPDKEDIVIVKATKKQDCLFCETVGIQTLKIFTKLSELKEKNLDNSEEKNNDTLV
jgi:DNA-directed DNA polymerase III PolC